MPIYSPDDFAARSEKPQTMNSHHQAVPMTAKQKAVRPQTLSAAVSDPLISVDQAAQKLMMHPKTLVRKARAGEIPGRKVANKWRFRALELDAWVDSQSGSRIGTPPVQPSARRAS
jgi:excisionase family DNA binding protein